MKKKSLTMLLTGLLAVSLTGVGFASWIIVQGDEKLADGAVSVETVENKKVEIVPVWQDNDKDTVVGSYDTDYETSNTDLAKIDSEGKLTNFGDNQFSFGAPAASSTGWLRSDTTYKEILTLKLDVYVVANSDVCTGIDAVITPSSEFTSAVTKTYLTNVTAAVAEDPTTKTIGEGDSAKSYTVYTVTISTSWGAFWESQNPYKFYTAAGKNASTEITVDGEKMTYAEHAEEYLGDLYNTLNKATFSLTLTANV